MTTETIQEIQKVEFAQEEFIHLATNKSNYYFLSDIAQFPKASKSKFYQKLFEADFSFQINHGLSDVFIWVLIPKDKNSISNGLERITNLFKKSINLISPNGLYLC